MDQTLTQAGFTGLGITPNAHLLGWGTAAFTYDNQMPGVTTNPNGHNYVLGFGLLPNLEVVGRIATGEVSTNCFIQACRGPRDLSVSTKAGIGLDTAGRFRIAAGVTDFGGAATNFRSYYGVATFNDGPYEVSAGLARRSAASTARNRSPLHGPFAAAAWQPLPWVKAQAEYTDGNAWAGVRLFAPQQWLPEGWQAHLGVNQRVTSTTLTSRTWWTAGLSIPLYKVPQLPGQSAKGPAAALSGGQAPLPAYEARTPAAQPAGASAPAAPAAPPAPMTPAAAFRPPADDTLHSLAQALQAKGLEDISVGRMPDGSITVRADNAAYNWNALDALGAALGAVARTLGDTKTGYRLVLTQRQVGLVAVTGQTDCLRQWIQEANPGCAAGELSTPGTGPLDRFQDGAVWVVRNLQPSNRTVRVALTPTLRTSIATEVGTFDYSAGVNLGLRLPVWAGADVEWRLDQELARTDNFQPTGAFGNRRIRSGTERLTFTQTVRLPVETWLAPGNDLLARRWGLGSVFAQATAGRIGHHFDGVLASARWEPGEGLHRVSAQAGYFRNSDFGSVLGEPKTARPFLAQYRYNVAPTRTYLEATAGQFMNNDTGVQFGMRQWFSDLSVGVYYRRSKFSNAAARSFVGMELSIPIGPRRDMDPRGVQVTGTPRFAHSVNTVVGNTTNNVVGGYGVLPPAPSLETTFNSDRAGLLYFEDNIRRIRDAAR